MRLESIQFRFCAASVEPLWRTASLKRHFTPSFPFVYCIYRNHLLLCIERRACTACTMLQGDSERTDVFWTASTWGGGVVRLWWGMARPIIVIGLTAHQTVTSGECRGSWCRISGFLGDHFHLSGYVNKQNCRYWSPTNPETLHQDPLHSPKVTVWCAVSPTTIIGRYFFQDDAGQTTTVNDGYWTILKLPRLLFQTRHTPPQSDHPTPSTSRSKNIRSFWITL